MINICPICKKELNETNIKQEEKYIAFEKKKDSLGLFSFYQCPDCGYKTFLPEEWDRFLEKREEFYKNNDFDGKKCCKTCLHKMGLPSQLCFMCGYYDNDNIEVTDDYCCGHWEDRNNPSNRNYIETPRLILRKLEEDDASDIYNNWASDSEVTKYVGWKTHDSINDSKNYLKEVDKKSKNPSYRNWGIVLKDNWKLIGTVDLKPSTSEANTGELGYVLGRNWWNQGIMTEAVGAIIKWAFDNDIYKKIQAHYDDRNIASGQVVKNNGMSYLESTLNESYNEKYSDKDITVLDLVLMNWYEIQK